MIARYHYKDGSTEAMRIPPSHIDPVNLVLDGMRWVRALGEGASRVKYVEIYDESTGPEQK